MTEKNFAVRLSLSLKDQNGEDADPAECSAGIYTVLLEVIATPSLFEKVKGDVPLLVVYNLITTLVEPGKNPPELTVLSTNVPILLPGITRHEMGTLTLRPGTLHATADIWTEKNGEAPQAKKFLQWTTVVRE